MGRKKWCVKALAREGKRKDRESVMGTKLNTKVIKLMIYKKRWCLQKWGINFWIIYEPVRSHIHDPFQSHFFRSWRDLGVQFLLFRTPLRVLFCGKNWIYGTLRIFRSSFNVGIKFNQEELWFFSYPNFQLLPLSKGQDIKMLNRKMEETHKLWKLTL